MDSSSTLLSDFLGQLGVAHTRGYTSERYVSMPFPTLFGLKKLLEEYGVESRGIRLENPADIVSLPTPFLARTVGGFIIVTACDGHKLDYISSGQPETIAVEDFTPAWCGTALLAYPRRDAREPGYGLHKRLEIAQAAKRWILIAIAVGLGIYLFVSGGQWRHWSMWGIAAIDLAGIYISWLLLQKTLKIHSRAADRVCGVIEAGGCDDVVHSAASEFFGLFSWSEVGFTYFSVSLLCLLIFPEYTPYLAAINVCCLPYSFWSVWYQKFRAKAWCTLCLTVQASLWGLFGFYLAGGWLSHVFPLRIQFFVLGFTYAAVLLALNSVMPRFENRQQ